MTNVKFIDDYANKLGEFVMDPPRRGDKVVIKGDTYKVRKIKHYPEKDYIKAYIDWA